MALKRSGVRLPSAPLMIDPAGPWCWLNLFVPTKEQVKPKVNQPQLQPKSKAKERRQEIRNQVELGINLVLNSWITRQAKFVGYKVFRLIWKGKLGD